MFVFEIFLFFHSSFSYKNCTFAPMQDDKRHILFIVNPISGTSSKKGFDKIVEKVISQLGMPDGSSTTPPPVYDPKAIRKLYRDTDDIRIAGICSGLALYFGIDTALVRIIMLVALIAGSAGFWIYVILWIAVPKAITPAQKCELRGLPPTAENLSKFTTYKK